MRENLDLLCINLVCMPYVGGNEYVQSSRTQQDKIRSWSRMKKMLAIKFYPLNCDELFSYTKQDYYYWPRNSYLNYFEEPNISPLKEELHVEENIVLEDYVEVKEQNIEIPKKLMKVLLWKKILKSRLLWRRIIKILL